MAKLSTFSRNAKAMKEGDWVNPGAEYGGIEIKTKAMNSEYADARANALRLAAREFFGNEAKIGSEKRNKIDIQALIDNCLLDIRGLEHADGRPVSIDEFNQMILEPQYGELAIIAFQCAGQVGRVNANMVEEAEGN